MLSIGLWRWYISITITILDIIHRPAFYLKQRFGAAFFLRVQAEPTQFNFYPHLVSEVAF
jgi:hypothetical protein